MMNKRIAELTNERDTLYLEKRELQATNAALLEALEGINTLLKIWLLDPGKAPHTLVASIQAITQPAIRKARTEE